MKVLFTAGSLRSGSFNKLYVHVAYLLAKKQPGVEATLVNLNEFPLPVYNQDIETSDFPESAKNLAKLIAGSDAMVISSPENNGSIAAVLKNTVDWVSRVPTGSPWTGKHILLLGASPGALGAVRGLWHTRVPFEALGCHVFPEMSGLPKANQAFDEEGNLKDKTSEERLSALVGKFIQFIT
jgi:NAD(P)H-dependent FMN reductase